MQSSGGKPASLLPKVAHAGLKELLILVAGYVAVAAVAPPLRVAHLAQYPPVGGGDALDGAGRAVGIPVDVGGGVALQVDILEGDLAVFSQPPHGFGVGHKPALAVGHGYGVYVAGIAEGQPGRLDRGNPRVDHPGDMASQGVVGQRRVVGLNIPNLPVGDQPQLDEGLEAVANTQHQAVPVV